MRRRFKPGQYVIASGEMSKRNGIEGMRGLIVDVGWHGNVIWVEFGERQFCLPQEELKEAP